MAKLQNWQVQFLLANAEFQDQPEKCTAALGENEQLPESYFEPGHQLSMRSGLNPRTVVVTAHKTDMSDGDVALLAPWLQYKTAQMLLTINIMRPTHSSAPASPASRGSEADSPPGVVLSSEARPVSVLSC